jgi:hypothetical protein
MFAKSYLQTFSFCFMLGVGSQSSFAYKENDLIFGIMQNYLS